jgi:hypothetical protein
MRDYNMRLSILVAALLLMIPNNRCYGEVRKYCFEDQANFAAAVDRVLLAWRQTQDCRDNPEFVALRNALDGPSPPNPLIRVICWDVDNAETNPDTGRNSTVSWNPRLTMSDSCPSGPPIVATPEIVLLHELAHAAYLARGIGCVGPPQFGSATLCEQQAIAIENMYRRAHSLPMRTCHSGQGVGLAAVLPCCRSGQVACNDRCCDGNATCVAGTCNCTGGTQACVTACCTPPASCGQYTDARLPALINLGGACCSPGTVLCVWRQGGGNSWNPLSTACCTSTQSCRGDPSPGQPGGCVPRS